MSKNTNLTLQRILAVEWELHDEAVASHMKLLKEHFRRMVLWAKQLNCVKVWPYFSVAIRLDPTSKVDEEDVRMLRKHLKDRGVYSPLMIGQLQHSLQWDIIPDNLRTTFSALPDPYEPLLVMYERGGIFSLEDGFLIRVSERLGFSKGQWSDFDKSTPYVELDKASLDSLDLEWHIKQGE